MEASLAQSPPTLPDKSALRASRFLQPISTKSVLDNEQPPLSPATAPHEVYLSSEEDASSSADDFSDYDFDSDSELDPVSPKTQYHQETTARAVSVVFYGKPSLVTLRPRSTSPNPVEAAPVQRMQRTSTDPTMVRRRLSISSTTSSSIFSPFSRSSTILPSSSTTSHIKDKPSFLSIDPYASKSDLSEPSEPERPRTPGAMLKRTFSLARKRSRPSLYMEPSQSRDNLSIHSAQSEPESQPQEFSRGHKRSGNYQDVVQAARMLASSDKRASTPTTEADAKPSYKSHSRLRKSGPSISLSLGLRKH